MTQTGKEREQKWSERKGKKEDTREERKDETKVEIWRRNKSDCKNHCQVFEL